MTRRPAVTLIEALMAIFVMAIGLLALLTLFPLGALQMAQALRDQRAKEMSDTATCMYKTFQLGNDAIVNAPGSFTQGGPTAISVTNPSAFQNSWLAAGLPTLTSGPSYPLYVDPYYVANDPIVPWNQQVVGQPGGANTFGIRRRTVQNPVIASNPARWFTLQDDLTFTENGLSAPLGDPNIGNNPVQREGRYSFAYMLRQTSAGNADLPLDLTVVVYSGRQPGPNITGLPTGESAFDAVFVSDRIVQVLVTGGKLPSIRRGTWILDTRIDPNPNNPAASPFPYSPQGYFYRTTNVTDLGDRLELEVQAPHGAQWPNPPVTGPLSTIRGPIPGPGIVCPQSIVIMDNVIDVFEKSTNY
jgi:hypothetical protein